MYYTKLNRHIKQEHKLYTKPLCTGSQIIITYASPRNIVPSRMVASLRQLCAFLVKPYLNEMKKHSLRKESNNIECCKMLYDVEKVTNGQFVGHACLISLAC